MIIEAIAGTTDFNLNSAVALIVTFVKLLVNAFLSCRDYVRARRNRSFVPGNAYLRRLAERYKMTGSGTKVIP